MDDFGCSRNAEDLLMGDATEFDPTIFDDTVRSSYRESFLEGGVRDVLQSSQRPEGVHCPIPVDNRYDDTDWNEWEWRSVPQFRIHGYKRLRDGVQHVFPLNEEQIQFIREALLMPDNAPLSKYVHQVGKTIILNGKTEFDEDGNAKCALGEDIPGGSGGRIEEVEMVTPLRRNRKMLPNRLADLSEPRSFGERRRRFMGEASSGSPLGRRGRMLPRRLFAAEEVRAAGENMSMNDDCEGTEEMRDLPGGMGGPTARERRSKWARALSRLSLASRHGGSPDQMGAENNPPGAPERRSKWGRALSRMSLAECNGSGAGAARRLTFSPEVDDGGSFEISRPESMCRWRRPGDGEATNTPVGAIQPTPSSRFRALRSRKESRDASCRG